MRVRVWSAAALVCEMIGVVMLFFWAWPQPSFDTENLLSVGEAQNAREIASHKRWHSTRALVGLGFLAVGYGIQISMVLFVGSPALKALTEKPQRAGPAE